MSPSHEPRSALLEGAERLDRLVRSIKDAQLGATGAPRIVPEKPDALRPEEAWVRQFGTYSIRPGRAGAAPLPVFTAPVAEGPESLDFTVPAAPAPASRTGGHIGSALGKPGRRRSWVARLFGRR